MVYIVAKIALTTLVVVLVSEIAKRSTFWGGLLASVPLVSFLALGWIYFETRDTVRLAALSVNIFWLVLPSLAFFLALPMLLRAHFPFYVSFSLATVIMLVFYIVFTLVLRRLRALTIGPPWCGLRSWQVRPTMRT